MRVVSLVPSATEIVCALGLGDTLVGRSHECDHPPWVERLPVLTAAKFPTDGTSADIDRRVRAVLREGDSVYRVFEERLDALRPDVVLTQAKCEVCAVSLGDVQDAVDRMDAAQPRVVSLQPDRLGDVWEDIRRVAAALGVPERGEALVAELRARVERVRETARRLERRPRVACIEWIEPLMAAGHWVPELIELAGGVPLFGEVGAPSPRLDPESLAAAEPDVVLVAPCGFGIQRTLEELRGWPWFPDRVVVADGNHYFNRPGPRLVDSLEILAEVLHPGVCGPAHRGSAWVPLRDAPEA